MKQQAMLQSQISLLSPADGRAATAVLVRDAASEPRQRALYGELCSTVRASDEWHDLSSRRRRLSSDARPAPLCVWQHPYTKQTNARAKPDAVLDWAHGLARRVAADLHEFRGVDPAIADAIDRAKYDSLLSVLYAPAGTLQPHIDKGLDGYGLALSFGATCVFSFGGTEIELSSGDVLFAPFGSVEHAVLRTMPLASAPAWWQAIDEQRDEAATFGAARCSLQLRDRAWSHRPHPTEPDRLLRRSVRRREESGEEGGVEAAVRRRQLPP